MGLVQKAFSDIITFSRSSNATRVGPTGLVEYAPHNLALRSEEFDNAYWSKDQSSIVANSVAAPNGTVTADKIVEDTATQTHGIYRLGLTVTSGLTYTWSVYAKKAERNWIILSAGGGANNSAWFNLNTGAAGTIQSGVAAATITSVGNDWYRCSVTRTVSSGSANFECYASTADNTSSYTGNGTSGIFLWGAQLSVGPYALDYTPTTSAAVYGPRFDYNGSGVTIVEPVSRNLLLNSEQFDSGNWTTAGSSVIANQVTSPSGILNADQLTESTASATRHGIFQAVSPVTAAAIHTFSVYVKNAVGTRFARIVINGAAATDMAVVDVNPRTGTIAQTLSNGVTGVSSSVSNAGNGWYRVTITGTIAINYVSVILITGASVPLGTDFGYEAYTADNTSGVYLWGAQLEVGSTATGYMVSGATNGFRAVPVVSGSATPRGLLVEEQRTNLCLYSEQFDNAAWTQSFLTENITANSATSPSGQVTADTIADSVTTAEFAVGQNISATANVPNTFSVFAKANGSNFLYLRYYGNIEQYYYTVIFDLSLGTATKSQIGSSASNGSNTITSVGNGWYRLTVTATVDSGNLIPMIGIAATGTDTIGTFGNISVNGTGNRSCFIWGAQLEAGSFATSYIPTLASTVTRSADVASVNTLSPWFNATEGTLFTDADLIGSASLGMIAELGDGGYNNRIGTFGDQFAASAFIVDTGGVRQATLLPGSFTFNTPFRVAATYKVNDFAASQNGATVVTDTSGTIPTVTTLFLGYQGGGGGLLNGHIRRLAYYPRRLTNAELQALTA